MASPSLLREHGEVAKAVGHRREKPAKKVPPALFEVDEARVTTLSDVPMKIPCCVLLLGVSISAGCARHYNIMLNNGRVITALGKPKLNSSHDAFLYKDAEGKPGAVSAGSVKEIERR